jgi:hypothetical protein
LDEYWSKKKFPEEASARFLLRLLGYFCKKMSSFELAADPVLVAYRNAIKKAIEQPDVKDKDLILELDLALAKAGEKVGFDNSDDVDQFEDDEVSEFGELKRRKDFLKHIIKRHCESEILAAQQREIERLCKFASIPESDSNGTTFVKNVYLNLFKKHINYLGILHDLLTDDKVQAINKDCGSSNSGTGNTCGLNSLLYPDSAKGYITQYRAQICDLIWEK